jgi:hypothetical protein
MTEHRQILRKCVPCGKAHWLAPGKDYECPKCRRPFDTLAKAEKAHGVRPDFKPYWSENLDHFPVYIKSRRHWKYEMAKRGLTCKPYES